MDRRSTSSLLRDYAVPMQDPNAYSLNYEKDTTRDPRKGLLKKSSKKKKLTSEWLKDQTGLLKIDQAPVKKAKGGKVGSTKNKDKPGGSNAGTYSKSAGPFAGPSGGAPKGSYPIGSKSRGKSALKLAHNAPNPSGIKAAVYRKYPDLKKDKVKKAMEGARLGLGGMGRMQDKAPQPTNHKVPGDKVKIGLYKKRKSIKGTLTAFPH
jgi:hypothetical protein